jgi:benzodiazapine receptor
MRPSNWRSLAWLTFWLLLTFAVAYLAASFKPGAWYAQLPKPDWTPPPAVFAPVWTVLYALMGVAAWLAWRAGGWAGGALRIYLAQLVLNGLWSWLFFGLHDVTLALLDLVALWLLVLANVMLFWRLSRPAGLLLVPYGAWVFFAAVLNLSIWSMNLQ